MLLLHKDLCKIRWRGRQGSTLCAFIALLVANGLLLDSVPPLSCTADVMPRQVTRHFGIHTALGNDVHYTVAHGQAVNYGVAEARKTLAKSLHSMTCSSQKSWEFHTSVLWTWK